MDEHIITSSLSCTSQRFNFRKSPRVCTPLRKENHTAPRRLQLCARMPSCTTTAPHVFHLRFPASFSSSSVSCSVSGMNISLFLCGKREQHVENEALSLSLCVDSMDSKPEGREEEPNWAKRASVLSKYHLFIVPRHPTCASPPPFACCAARTKDGITLRSAKTSMPSEAQIQ